MNRFTSIVPTIEKAQNKGEGDAKTAENPRA